MNPYLAAWKKYAVFTGRAGRPEFWMFTAINAVVLGLLSAATMKPEQPNLIVSILSLIVIVPALAVTARRLHDMDRSGWWQLIMLIPGVGGLALLIWCALRGQPGANRFGEPPAG